MIAKGGEQGMLLSLRYNLARLTQFSGRQSAGRFWPYVGTIVVLAFLGLAAAILPMFADTMTRMQNFAAKHPDQATVTSGPGSYSISIEGNHPELFPDMTGMLHVMVIGMGIAVLLLAAAVTRRLHDRGKSGLWGLLPVPFLFLGLFAMSRVFASNPPDFSLFALLFFNNLVYLGALLFLIVQLAGGGTPGANAYGETRDQ